MAEQERMNIVDAQKLLAEEINATLRCDNIGVGLALSSVLIAIKKENYRLINLEKLLMSINDMAVRHAGHSESEIYLKCLEDITALIEDCLE